MNIARWRSGNQLKLLINGEEFYPRVSEAIAAARHEVLLETFILFDDEVGRALRDSLVAAAGRGVRVEISLDGYGCQSLSPEFLASMTNVGVGVRLFDPRPRLFGYRTNLFRRLHRKLIVVDGHIGFVGGINFSIDHLLSSGERAKQDYAVEVSGPVVDDIHDFLVQAIAPDALKARRRWFPWRRAALENDSAPGDGAQVLLVTRDNQMHRNDIERHYLAAIRRARERVYIANAYFFPGFRLLRELRRAVARGADVRLILQGKPDMPIAQKAAATLYRYLMRGGVHVYGYCKRPLHGKVAIMDQEWATVGSSNLDPLSLALNLEANLMIRDRDFAQGLGRHLEELIEGSCKEIHAADLPAVGFWQSAVGFFVFHFLRRFPSWAGWLPAHIPKLERVEGQVAPTNSFV